MPLKRQNYIEHLGTSASIMNIHYHANVNLSSIILKKRENRSLSGENRIRKQLSDAEPILQNNLIPVKLLKQGGDKHGAN